jgi:hypothetical protein
MLDNIITRENDDQKDAMMVDIHAGNRKNPRYHSLMGKN